jgi:hypothetical protein
MAKCSTPALAATGKASTGDSRSGADLLTMLQASLSWLSQNKPGKMLAYE